MNQEHWWLFLNENGQEIGRSELATAGAERVLAVEQEAYAGLKHSEQELVYVQVEMRDQNGVLAADDNQKIHCLLTVKWKCLDLEAVIQNRTITSMKE